MRVWALAIGLVASAIFGPVATGQQTADGEPLKWFKGNTHTHSLNSDGDSTPDEVVQWYREQRYHFLFFTDHNIGHAGRRAQRRLRAPRIGSW